MKILLFISLPLMISLLGCNPSPQSADTDKAEARAIMDDVSRRNLAYEPLTEHDDTMMQQVVAYYKEHGTAGELMEAYYLQGSVYRDLHKAPKAMEAFMNGISAADTTSTDCRYDLLTRLYGQKCEIQYQQSLYEQAIEANRLFYKYAVLAKDTLFMVAAQWKRMGGCYAFNDYQAVADECWDILEESQRLGMYNYGATWLCTCILANMELGRVEDARKLLSIYEQHSGCVDLKTHECSFPIYYYAKGRVLAATGQLDSAEYFYRKELAVAPDWNNRQAAYRGLRLAFEQMGQKDSVCKYAPLQCDAVDSAYQEMLSQNLQNLHELYDNNRLQMENNRKELQLQESRRKAQHTRLALAFVVVCSLFLFFWYKQRLTTAELKLERASAELEEQENNLAALREELANVVDERERLRLAQEVEQAERKTEEQRRIVMKGQEKLDKLQMRRRERTNSMTLRSRYSPTTLFQSLLGKIEIGKVATEQDYELVQETLIKDDAELLTRFSRSYPNPSDVELRAFLLLRLGMTKSEVSLLMSRSPAALTNTVTRLFQKINGQQCATSAQAYEWLLKV